jgi:hypothetical protein
MVYFLDRGGSWPRGLYHQIIDAPVVETFSERRLNSFDGKKGITLTRLRARRSA